MPPDDLKHGLDDDLSEKLALTVSFFDYRICAGHAFDQHSRCYDN